MNAPAAASGRLAIGPRFDRWLLDRVRRIRGAAELPLALEYRHIYVMPTRFGAWFGALLVLMAIGGLNFNNNMTLLMVFLLGSIAMLTTLLAYRNLVGIVINAIIARPVFAGCLLVLLVLVVLVMGDLLSRVQTATCARAS